MAGASPPPPPPPPPRTIDPLPAPVPGWQTHPTRASMFNTSSLESLAIRWGRILGFLLLFVGTLVAVIAGSIQPVCYASSGCANWPGTWAWAVISAQIIWTVALFFLGTSSGLQLMNGLRAPTGGTPEEYRWVQTERWFNFLMVALSIVLLWFLLSGVLALHPLPG